MKRITDMPFIMNTNKRFLVTGLFQTLFFTSALLFSGALLFIFPQSPAENNSDQAEEELARVAILAFRDDTGTKNFPYMPNSLSNAIDKSMQKNFRYERIAPERANAAWQEIQKRIADETQNSQESKKKKSEKKEEKRKSKESNGSGLGIADGEGKKERQEVKQIKELAETIDADVVIYGNFVIDPETSDIVFNVSLYLTSVEGSKLIPETRNAVDSTIFNATEKVGSTIVAEISQMVADYEKSSEKKTGEETEPAGPGEKTVLTREAAIDKKSWNIKKYDIGLQASVSGSPQIDSTEPVLGAMYYFRYYLKSGVHFGARFGIQSFKQNNNTAFVEFASLPLALLAGYAYRPTNRLQLFAQVNAGYYFGELTTRYYDYPETVLKVRNPYFGGRFGAEYLALSFLYVGGGFETGIFYDDPTSMETYGFEIHTGVVF